MEQQIQDLVASIKKEGIEEAKKQSAEILQKAKNEADALLLKAKEEAQKMIQDAKNKCALEEESAKAKILQASRDVSLELKKSIEALFTRILVKDVSLCMDNGLLTSLVSEVVKAGLKDVTIEVPLDKKESIIKALKTEVSKELLCENKLVLSGLKIVSNDGSGYIDLSAGECAELIKPYLSDKLREIIY